ncbi:MAG: hypothetical protein IT210_17005 [Armatimonadetes bacterium]|nr:hypothetical protein [Armatimonadota bacterium]
MPLTLDGRTSLEGLSDEMRYAHSVKLIAEECPLRVLPMERMAGSATLKMAAHHAVPVYRDGKIDFGSVSHLTPGFDRALRIGYRGLRQEIEERLACGGLDAKGVDLLEAMLLCLDAAALWHRRHIRILDDLAARSVGREQAVYREVRENLRNVPKNPPSTFREAVQSL